MNRTLPITLCLLFGCAFDAHRQDERCNRPADCPQGQICPNGLCVPAPPDGAVGEDAEPPEGDLAPPVDAVMDAQPVDLAPPQDMAPPRDMALPVDQALPVDLAPPIDQMPPPLPLPVSDPQVAARCAPEARCFVVDRDTFIDEDRANDQHEDDSALEVRRSNADQHRVWTLLRFDLNPWIGSRWPTGCDLWLRRRGSPNDDPEVDLVLQQLVGTVGVDWRYPTTWNSQPTPRGGSPLLPFAPVGPRQTQRVDVTPYVDALEAGLGFEGLGLLIKFDPIGQGEGELAFDSSDARDASAIPPYLECRYAQP